MKKNVIFLCFAVTAFLGSCTKEQQAIQPRPANANPKSSASAARIIVYPLDWENIDRMPTPPSVPSVLVPWASGASRQFPREMLNDFRRADGWELLYNTFNTQIVEPSWYFILYNKYRGLVRLYYYIPSGANFIASANIIHKLATEGSYASSSPIMNFAGQDIVDVNRNVTFASTLERFQVAPNTWYAFQYELAYDRNIGGQSLANINFIWPVTSSQIQEAKFNGNIDGSLKGSIKLPGNDLSASSVINIVNGNGQINVAGSSETDNLLKILGKSVVDGAKKAITKGVSGVVENLLSGIFSNKSSAENVSLKLNAKIDLKGTLTQNFLIQAKALAVSGYDQSSTVGFVPAYNKPLGVFYLARRPVINVTTTLERIIGGGGRGRTDGFKRIREYMITPAEYIFNPALLEVANVVVKEVKLVAEPTHSNIRGIDLRTEIINGSNYLSATKFITERTDVGADIAPPYRIAIDVIPKDGSPKVTIIKTFRPSIINQ